MTAQDSSSVERHFHAALPLSELRRDTYLRELATREPAIAAEVESLLRHAEGSALDGSIDALTSLASELGLGRLGIGQSVDDFEIVELIGEGGSGRVFRARQSQPARDVALKILRSGLDETRGRVLLELEAATLARLSHASIAHVYASGVIELENGAVPWIAMELVTGGVPITHFARAQGLDVRAVVALLVHVADGVAHAHRHGVVHRDLKPGNVLIDSTGAPKVIDFGIASGTRGQGTCDEFASPVGTPGYMSPEQERRGPTDPRSDVYSLGVLLRELIATTGQRAPRELDAIVSRATCAQHSGRYVDAATLARDLRAFLARRPVHAFGHSRAYVASCFVRRNPLATTAVALFLLSLVGGFAATAWGLARAQQARSDSQWGVDYFRQWLETSDPLEGRGPTVSFKDALRHASAQLDTASPPIAIEADLRHSLGVALQDAGESRKAQPHLERALELRRQQLGTKAEATLTSELELAYVMLSLADREGAYELAQHAAAGRAQHFGDHVPETFAAEAAVARAVAEGELVADPIDFVATLVERCRAHLGDDHENTTTVRTSLAVAYAHAHRWEDAAREYETVLRWRERELGDDDVRTSLARKSYAATLVELGRPGEAVAALERATDGIAATMGERHPHTIAARADLAVALRRDGQTLESLALTEQIVRDRKELLGADHPKTLETQINLATALMGASRAEQDPKATELRTRAVDLLENLHERRSSLSPRQRTALDANLGAYYASEERWTDAAEAFVRARETSTIGSGGWLDLYLEGRAIHASGRAEGEGPLTAATLERLDDCIGRLAKLRSEDDPYVRALERLRDAP